MLQIKQNHGVLQKSPAAFPPRLTCRPDVTGTLPRKMHLSVPWQQALVLGEASRIETSVAHLGFQPFFGVRKTTASFVCSLLENPKKTIRKLDFYCWNPTKVIEILLFRFEV